MKKDMRKIEVSLRSPRDNRARRSFRGRWLVLPGADAAPDSDALYGVAVTDRGRIAVYVRHPGLRWPPILSQYDQLDDVPNDTLPDNVRELAARALGEQFVVRLDPGSSAALPPSRQGRFENNESGGLAPL